MVSAKKYENNTIICVTLNCPDDWDAHTYYTEICEKKYNYITISNEIKIDLVGGNKNYVKCRYNKKTLPFRQRLKLWNITIPLLTLR